MKSKRLILIVAVLLSAVFTVGLRAQGTAFTYQGQLLTTSGPANGTYDLTFVLYNASSGGSQVGSTITDTGQSVSNGLFTYTMDFGAGIFNGTPYWLQIGVRTNGAASFVTLNSRQKLTPTPYAVTAVNVVNGGLPATYSSAVNFNNAANSFNGSGAGLTSLNASSLSSGTVPDARLSANVALLDRNQTFTGNQTFAGQLILPSPMATIYSGGTTVLHSDFNNINFFAGRGAGNMIVSGTANTGVGDDALISDLGGGGNTANGFEALYDNIGGNNNTASGAFALQANTSGSGNIAIGNTAGVNITTGSNNIDIGNQGSAGDNSIIRIGTPGVQTNTYLAGTVYPNQLQIGGTNGTAFSQIEAGQAIAPSSNTSSTWTTVTFPHAFSSTPHIIVSVSNDPAYRQLYTFAASVISSSATSFQVNISEVNDVSDLGWSQQLRINWLAWQ